MRLPFLIFITLSILFLNQLVLRADDSLDIEVDGTLSLNEAHEIGNKVEHNIKEYVDVYDIIVHIEPKGKTHHEEKFGVDKNSLSDKLR
jgi:hypothetical protein